MTVYLIHQGSMWEGGHTKEIYADEENAIKFAIMLVEQEKEMRNRMIEDELDKELFPQWSERECKDPVVKRWDDTMNEIYILKYEVK